jgi:hypothetical protein
MTGVVEVIAMVVAGVSDWRRSIRAAVQVGVIRLFDLDRAT